MNFSGKIKSLRETKKWSQDYVAAKIGMSTAGYGKIERGEVDITIYKAEQLLKVFDTNLLDLLLNDRQQFNIDENKGQVGILNQPTLNQNISQQLLNELFSQLKGKDEVIKELMALLKKD